MTHKLMRSSIDDEDRLDVAEKHRTHSCPPRLNNQQSQPVTQGNIQQKANIDNLSVSLAILRNQDRLLQTSKRHFRNIATRILLHLPR